MLHASLTAFPTFFLTWLVHIKKNIETVGKKLVKAACCDLYGFFPYFDVNFLMVAIQLKAW